MWYSLNDLLSKNRILSFVIGNRGGGKTFNVQYFALRDFINKGNKFIWLRRYNSEINQIKNKWCSQDLRNKFPEHEITFRGNNILIDDKQCGLMVALSTSQRLKSIDFSEYNKIIYDEFLIDKGSLRYINSEVDLYLEFFETVNRLSDRVRGIFIANAISIVNPYFKYFNIKPNVDQRFTMNEHVAIELYKDEDFINAKKKTKFGRMINNTSYGEYAIDNKFLRDNYSLICERPKEKLIYSLTINYNKSLYGVWLCLGKTKDSLYIDDMIEKECDRSITISMEELDEKCKFKNYDGLKPHIVQLKYMFNEGKVNFNSIQTKKDFFEIVKVL
jgi:hypothetical protein